MNEQTNTQRLRVAERKVQMGEQVRIMGVETQI